MTRPMLLAGSLALTLAWGSTRMAWPTVAGADEAGEEVAVVIHVDALPRFTAEGRALLRRYAADARKDEGAIRVEVFEERSRPNHSTIVEVWRARKAYDDHLGGDRTRAFRAELQPMLGSPFDERLHRTTP